MRELDNYSRSILEKHIDTMNDWADGGATVKAYEGLIELYLSFIKAVKDRIREMKKEVIEKVKQKGRR